MKEKKKALREAVKKAAARAMYTADGSDLADSIEALPEFAAAHTVALYHALPDEMPTAEMLRRWLGVKRLALPVIVADGEMVFCEYTGEDSLTSGAFGIPAPMSSRQSDEGATRDLIPSSEIDLALVPGVAFDEAGRRLGRGGGFYDRYFSHPAAAHIYKVGLCRAGALVAEVPAEAHDVAMDCVVTF